MGKFDTGSISWELCRIAPDFTPKRRCALPEMPASNAQRDAAIYLLVVLGCSSIQWRPPRKTDGQSHLKENGEDRKTRLMRPKLFAGKRKL